MFIEKQIDDALESTRVNPRHPEDELKILIKKLFTDPYSYQEHEFETDLKCFYCLSCISKNLDGIKKNGSPLIQQLIFKDLYGRTISYEIPDRLYKHLHYSCQCLYQSLH